MKTRPTAKVKESDKVLVSFGKKETTVSGEDCIRFAHELIKAGEKALKRAGKWKPG